MSVFSQLGQEKEAERMLAGIPFTPEEEAVYRAEYSAPGNWQALMKFAASDDVEDRFAMCRAFFGGVRGRVQDERDRQLYAMGCWVALEYLHDRLQKGTTLLESMRLDGEQGTKKFDRLSWAWLRLGFRSIGLISRMGWADLEISNQFCNSPTGQYFADIPFPSTERDVEVLLLKPAQMALEIH